MKTTLEIPDELMREIKVLAAREDRKLKDLVSELLRRGLAQSESEMESPRPRHRVKLPLVHSTRPASPGALSPERIHEILMEEDIEGALGKSDEASS